MRILLLSDIHSNLEALEASLAAAPPHDAVVNLGDIVGYGASPNEVTSKVRELGRGVLPQTVVRGNHDKVVAGLDNVETFNPMAGMAALEPRHLTSDNLEGCARCLRTNHGPRARGNQFVHGAGRRGPLRACSRCNPALIGST